MNMLHFSASMHESILYRHIFIYLSTVLPNFSLKVKNVPYTRLCSTKNILTVNGQFPGPTLHVNKGDTIVVDVLNKANYNITIHW